MDVSLPHNDWPQMDPGWVWLCGAGPGDPGLLTLHALNALRQADVVIYDALVQDNILDWAPQAELIYAGIRGGKPSAKQRDISLRLVDLARDGKRVLRLKGGDPFVFGRGGEEAQTLVQHGVPIRIIPGISAGIGGLAYAVTSGRSALAPFGITLGVWLVTGAATELWTRAGRGDLSGKLRRLSNLPRADWGKAVAHAGLGVTFIGVACLTAWQVEDIRVANLDEIGRAHV